MSEIATTAPERARLQAVALANQVRHTRAQLKRQLAAGKLSAADVLLDPPPEAMRWPVGELLTSQRRWGAAKTQKFLQRNGINDGKPLKALTPRQRQLLASQLRGRLPDAADAIAREVASTARPRTAS